MSDDLVAWFRDVLDDEWPPAVLRVEDERARADIAAKRAVLDLHESAERYTAFGADDWRIGQADGLRLAVQHLAVAYADRPGYREEWRP